MSLLACVVAVTGMQQPKKLILPIQILDVRPSYRAGQTIRFRVKNLTDKSQSITNCCVEGLIDNRWRVYCEDVRGRIGKGIQITPIRPKSAMTLQWNPETCPSQPKPSRLTKYRILMYLGKPSRAERQGVQSVGSIAFKLENAIAPPVVKKTSI